VLISFAILNKDQDKTATRSITTNLLLPLKKGGWEGLRSSHTKSLEYPQLPISRQLPRYFFTPFSPTYPSRLAPSTPAAHG
jgi:hypothetical protein